MPRKIKKRSTFRRRGNGPVSGDMFRCKTIKSANSKQSMKKGYVK